MPPSLLPPLPTSTNTPKTEKKQQQMGRAEYKLVHQRQAGVRSARKEKRDALAGGEKKRAKRLDRAKANRKADITPLMEAQFALRDGRMSDGSKVAPGRYMVYTRGAWRAARITGSRFLKVAMPPFEISKSGKVTISDF